MKPVLDRTAILSRDVGEQPPGPYVVFLLETGFVFSCHQVATCEQVITVFGSEDTAATAIARFSPAIPWIQVRADRLETVTREAQLRRLVEIQVAEQDVLRSCAPADSPHAEVSIDSLNREHERPGQYI